MKLIHRNVWIGKIPMEKEEEDRVSECKCEKTQRATHNTGHRLVTNYNQSRYARYTRKSETTSTTHRERERRSIPLVETPSIPS